MSPEAIQPWVATVMAPTWKSSGQRYFRRRLAWYRKIGWPVTGHEAEPDPGALALDDPEEG